MTAQWNPPRQANVQFEQKKTICGMGSLGRLTLPYGRNNEGKLTVPCGNIASKERIPGCINQHQFAIVKATEFLSMYKQAKQRGDKSMTVLGHTVKMKSHTVKLFDEKGITCVSCGVTGVIAVVESAGTNHGKHCNIYGVNSAGKLVSMTKDHIIPKSKGGKNELSNHQVMCQKCRSQKSNKMQKEAGTRVAVQNDSEKTTTQKSHRIEVRDPVIYKQVKTHIKPANPIMLGAYDGQPLPGSLHKNKYVVTTADEFITAYENAVANQKTTFSLGDCSMRKKNQRYRLFFEKGMVCVSCGATGEIAIVESPWYKGNPHVNVYAIDLLGNLIPLTKDHILPKSLGGTNSQDNYQVMCKDCNVAKSNGISVKKDIMQDVLTDDFNILLKNYKKRTKTQLLV